MQYSLRPYQQSAVDAALNWIQYRRGIHGYILAPGGSGKSVMIAKLAERVHDTLKLPVVILARNEKLLRQNMAKLSQEHQLRTGVYCAGLGGKDLHSPITIASIQSIYMHGDHFKGAVILADEAHNISNNPDDDTQYWQFMRAAEGFQLIGFTATPYRTLGGLIGWGEEIISIPLAPLFNDGFLVPPVNKCPMSPDLSGVAISMGEFVQEQLESVYVDRDVLYNTIEVLLQYRSSNRKCCVIFTQSRKHSALLMQAMLDNAVCQSDEVICVDGNTDKDDLSDVHLKNWADPQHPLKYVINCGLLKEGVDVPEIDCVVVLRSTISKTLWEQMLYRGTRPADGKRDFLVLDMGGNFERHGGLGVPYPKGTGKSKKEQAAIVYGKICPRCQTFAGGVNTLQCPDCGFEFPEQEQRKVDHNSRPNTSDGVSTYYDAAANAPQWHEVSYVTYAPHKSKAKGTWSLKVTYDIGYQTVNEWLSPFSESSWARNRFREYFIAGGNDVGNVAPLLERHTPEEVLGMLVIEAEKLKKPSHIKVDFSKQPKYGEVKGMRYDKQEADRSGNTASPSALLEHDFIPF